LLKAKRLQHDVIVHESGRGGSKDLWFGHPYTSII
jgi:hypothetical protein